MGTCFFVMPNLLLYLYLPILFISFLMAVFIFFSDKKNQLNINLAIFILCFFFWELNGLFQWLTFDIKLSLLLARIGTLEVLSLMFFVYFVYYLLEENLDFKKKIIIALPFLPVVLLLFTNYNMYSVGDSCDTVTGELYWYIYFLVVLSLVLIVRLLVKKFRDLTTTVIVKQRLKIITSAVVFLISWFLLFVKISDMYAQSGGDYVAQYTPIGMLLFIGMLSYIIVKYQMFNIKMIAAQALTYAIWILIGSQFFFAESTTAYVLIAVTLLLSVAFGIFLIKSVKREAERKEELQIMADRLASANDSLRKLDNAKTEFISIASHQLRTPVTAIKGFSSLLLEGSYGEISEGVHGALEKVYSSSERLVNLIEDLLNVSRIESGRMIFAFEKASVEKLIKELYDNFILIAKTKKFYLDMKLPETPLPEVVMDYSKVRELVSNFMDNALKYTEKGGATIKAELRETGVVIDEHGFVIPDKVSEFGKMIRITVSDTGIGIPHDEIPYLFKKFSRGKDVSRLHVGGTGLGLFVGKAIAEAHHGQVWVESDGTGLGSRFIIEIPVEHAA